MLALACSMLLLYGGLEDAGNESSNATADDSMMRRLAWSPFRFTAKPLANRDDAREVRSTAKRSSKRADASEVTCQRTANKISYTSALSVCEENAQAGVTYTPFFGGRTVEKSDDACRVRCQSTPGCHYWSRWVNGGCHLFEQNAVVRTDKDACNFDGAYACHSGSCSVKRTVEASDDECQTRCSQTKGCYYWSRWVQNGVCDLYGIDAIEKAEHGVHSGKCTPLDGGLALEAAFQRMKKENHAMKVAQARMDIGCSELQLKMVSFPDQMVKAFQLLEDNVISQQELAALGNIGRVRQQMACYVGVLQRLQLRGKNICEIGVNGGHSAALMLSNSDASNTYIGFDLDPRGAGDENRQAQHDETALNPKQQARVIKAHRHLNRFFNGRFKLVLGDSKVAGPKYLTRKNATCDLLSIDGDHSPQGIVGDWRAFRDFTEPGTLVFLDDVEDGHIVWQEAGLSQVACFRGTGVGDALSKLHSDSSLPAGLNFCVGMKV